MLCKKCNLEMRAIRMIDNSVIYHCDNCCGKHGSDNTVELKNEAENKIFTMGA